MRDIKFSCTHCAQHLEAPLNMAGEGFACPACQKQIQVPSQVAAAWAEPAPPQSLSTESHTPSMTQPKQMKGMARLYLSLGKGFFGVAYLVCVTGVLALLLLVPRLGWVLASTTAFVAAGGLVYALQRCVAARQCLYRVEALIESGARDTEIAAVVESDFGLPPNFNKAEDAWETGIFLYLPFAVVGAKSGISLGLPARWAVPLGAVIAIPFALCSGVWASNAAAQRRWAKAVRDALKESDAERWDRLAAQWAMLHSMHVNGPFSPTWVDVPRELLMRGDERGVNLLISYLKDPKKGWGAVDALSNIAMSSSAQMSTQLLMRLSRLEDIEAIESLYGGSDEDREMYGEGLRSQDLSCIRNDAWQELRRRGTASR